MIQHSGIGTYIRGLLSGMTPTQLKEMWLLGDPDLLNSYTDQIIPFHSPIYGPGEQILLPRLLARHPLTLFHSPHFNIPLLYCGRLVVTIHDMIHIRFPSFSRLPLARIYALAMIKQCLRKASWVITDSESTKRDLMDRGAPQDRLSVIPLAIDETLFREASGSDSSVLDKYSLAPGFFLYVGNIRKIKNVPGLVAAYLRLKRADSTVPPLVIAGKDQMPQWTRQYEKDPSIRILTDVPFQDLPAFYRSAIAFVFPSFFEGFGLPPLEAMACGCPVISSRAGSLPEVLGEASLAIDPHNVGSIADAMKQLFVNSSLRLQLIARGREQVKRYSWKTTARETFKIYGQLLEGKSHAA